MFFNLKGKREVRHLDILLSSNRSSWYIHICVSSNACNATRTRTSVMALLRYSVPSCALNSVVSGKLIKIICCHKWLYGYEPCLLNAIESLSTNSLRFWNCSDSFFFIFFLFYHCTAMLERTNSIIVKSDQEFGLRIKYLKRFVRMMCTSKLYWL